MKERPPTVAGLSKAYGMVIGMGLRSKDLQLALEHTRGGDMDLAIKYLYGPTPFDNGEGAIKYFEDIKKASKR